MKKTFLMVAAAAFLAGSATAAIDFTQHTTSVAVTQAQLDTIASTTASNPWGIDFAPNGDLLVMDDPGGGAGALIRVNVDTATGSIIRTEAAMLADMSQGTDFDVDHVRSGNATTIYFNEHDAGNGVNQVVKVDISGTPVASQRIGIEGNNGMAVLPSGNIVLTLLTGFGATANEIGVVDAVTGVYTTKVTQADIIAVTAAAGVNVPLVTLNPLDNSLLVWDEAAFGGSDSLLKITNIETTPVITDVTPAPWENGGLSQVVADNEGNIYAYNEFDADAGEVGINVWNGTTMAVITKATLQSELGSLAAFDINAPGGLAVRRPSANVAELFLAETFNLGGIAKITFSTPAGVDNWSKY